MAFACSPSLSCEDAEFHTPQLWAHLQSTEFAASSLKLSFFFEKYARMNIWKPVCTDCVQLFLFLFALFDSSEDALSWIDEDYVFEHKFTEDDDDLDGGESDDNRSASDSEES